MSTIPDEREWERLTVGFQKQIYSIKTRNTGIRILKTPETK